MATPEMNDTKAWAEVESEENPELGLAKVALEARKQAADEAEAAAVAAGLEPSELPADDPIAIANALADEELKAQGLTKEDPVKKLTNELSTLQQQLKEQSEAAAKRERDLNGRYGGLARELEQVRAEATAAKAAAATPVQAAAISEAAKTPEKWEAFKKEWEGSGLTEAVEDFVASQKPAGADPAVLERLVAERLQAERQAMEQRFAEQHAQIVHLTMSQAHPGWLDTVKSDEFLKWRAAQPPAIQQLGASPNPQDAIEMLNQFVESTATAADKSNPKRSRLEHAVSHTRPEHQPRKQLSIADMTSEQLWAYEARLEAAQSARAN